MGLMGLMGFMGPKGLMGPMSLRASEAEQVFHGEQACVVLCIFSGEDGSHREASAAMGIVGDGYHVLRRVVRNGVYAGHLFLADVVEYRSNL